MVRSIDDEIGSHPTRSRRAAASTAAHWVTSDGVNGICRPSSRNAPASDGARDRCTVLSLPVPFETSVLLLGTARRARQLCCHARRWSTHSCCLTEHHAQR